MSLIDNRAFSFYAYFQNVKIKIILLTENDYNDKFFLKNVTNNNFIKLLFLQISHKLFKIII